MFNETHSKLSSSDYIDHINKNKLDNRKDNLRVCSSSINMQNIKVPKNNKTGHIGVSFYKPYGIYRAYITKNGECIHIGYFNSLNEAVIARKEAEKIYHKETHGV